MHESTLLILGVFCLLNFILVIVLLGMLRKNSSESVNLTTSLLQAQLLENQSLRNQLRAPSLPALMGLNNATMPTEATASNEQGGPVIDLDTAIGYEEELARQGYTVNDLGDDLSAQGWSGAIMRKDANGNPVTFE